jgi:hypothetical protein
MRRLVRVLAVIVVALALPWLTPTHGEAGEVRTSAGAPGWSSYWAPAPARTPSVQRSGDRGGDRDDGRRRWHGGSGHHHHHGHHHHYRPGVVLVAPARCWQPGYWAQQWVAQAHTYPTWVAGHWSQEGRWVQGHYVPYVHHTGYYQPYWIEGYWLSC